MTHTYYACSALLLVLSIYRPFITKLDRVKYLLFGTISFMLPFAALLENEKINIEANTVNKNNTLSALSLYMSPNMTWIVKSQNYSEIILSDALVLALLTAITITLCGLLSRWQFSILFVQPKSNVYISGFTRYGVSTALGCLGLLSSHSAYASHSTTLSIMGALWYISGPYLARRWKTVIIASFLSSVIGFFICYTSYNSCLNLLSYQDWALFGTLLVISCNVLDHLDALLNTYPHLAVGNDIQKKTKIQSPTSISYWMAIATLILNMPSETDLHPGPIQDLQTAIKVLGPASRSWKTMAALFPTNLRQDLCLLYAFFRTADDLVDDAPTPAQCKENLVIIRRFLREVFIKKGDPKDNRQSENSPSRDLTLPNHVNWNYYAQVLPTSDVIAVFRNFARISHYLCPRAMSELTDAWEHDLKGEPVKRQEDLLHYAALISGTFGELCTCVIMYKTGHGNWNGHDKISRDEEVLSRARATGQCLQLINIARDIIADSLDGRCYVPLQYMPIPSLTTYHILKVAKNPMKIGESTLKSFSLRILNLADRITDKAQKGIDGLPEEVQDGIRAAFEIYMAISPTLRNDPGFPLRAKVPKPQQQWIALRCIYGFHGPIARAIYGTCCELISAYSRTLARLSPHSGKATSKVQ